MSLIFKNKETAKRFELTDDFGKHKIIAERWKGLLEEAPPEVVAAMIRTKSNMVREKIKPEEVDITEGLPDQEASFPKKNKTK